MKWMVCQLGKVDLKGLLKFNKDPNYIIPSYKVDKIKNRTKVKVDTLLYQNYMFVRDLESFNKLKSKYKDIHLLMTKHHLTSSFIVLKIGEIEESTLLKCIERSLDITMENAVLDIDTVIKIKDGPFMGQQAKVISSGENKVKVEIVLFNRKMNLDLYREDVEPVR